MADLHVVTEEQASPPHSDGLLMRELLGATLRSARRRQERTLKDVAERAGVSMTYLSEIERGHKEASSEVIAAITRSLGGELVDLLSEMATRAMPVRPTGVAMRAVA